ncbi:hypothetical protein [Pontibacter sp. G13]|uniref:hypothetical protein n=1 Tax=Pontibacter sp. G13 TaxID=3074898 RepID=UPI002889FD82|nr:hypothetical protein [Pontibacter sp. G13]WNJ21585.1 hypothetical protein RJD25_29035 [Pontibacter sp. G13]
MTRRILLIGNSHTLRNDLAYMVEEMIRQERPLDFIEIAVIAHDRATLDEHLQAPMILRRLAEGWSHVCIQPHSDRPITHPDKLAFNVGEIARMARESDAVPLLVMNWCKAHLPHTQLAISSSICQIAEQVGIGVVPVGLIWEKCRQLFPEIPLYERDNRHALPIGSWLYARALTAAILGLPPTWVPKYRSPEIDADQLKKVRTMNLVDIS